MKKISLSSLRDEQYDKAKLWFSINLWFKFFAVFLNILLIIWDSDNLSGSQKAWIVVATILVVTLVDQLFSTIYRRYYSSAEELRVLQFNYYNLKIKIHPSQLSYHIADSKLSKIDTKDIEFDENYFENQNLKFNLLQNIFFTSLLFKTHGRFYLCIIFLALFSIVSVLIISIYKSALNAYLETTYLQVFTVMLTSLFAFNILPIFRSFQKKQQSLRWLDKSLSNLDNNDHNQLISVLINYNTILCDAYPVFDFLYKIRGKQINTAWKIRIDDLFSKSTTHDAYQEILRSNFQDLFGFKLRFKKVLLDFIGSISEDTFINGHSDLDVLLVFELSENSQLDEYDPFEFYNQIFKMLRAKYSYNLLESRPAFIVHDFNDLIIEFTPCLKIAEQYYMVGNSNRWQEIFPKKQSEFFKNLEKATDGRFGAIFKEIKEWKYSNNIQIRSFYLQCFLLKLFDDPEIENPSIRTSLLKRFYSNLLESNLEDIEDPFNAEATVKALLKHVSKNYQDEIVKQIQYYSNEESETEN